MTHNITSHIVGYFYPYIFYLSNTLSMITQLVSTFINFLRDKCYY